MNLNAEVPATALGMEHINTNSSNLEELEAQVARVRAKLERTESQKNFEVVDAIEGEIVGKTEED
jgi:exo-beta-1,3-glucanase (GH17 family)